MRYVNLILISLSLVFAGCGEWEKFEDKVEDWWDAFEEVNEETIDVLDPSEPPNDDPIATTTTTTIIPATNPICDRIYGLDGGGGFLWKAVSEHGTVAVQLPGVFATKFDSCEVHGQYAYEALSFHGFHNWDGQDQYKRDRQLWRGTHPGSYYGGNINLICKQPTQECSWQFGGAHTRQD